ncbi:MAG: hypothetical protein ACRDNB_08185 [Gaiellaceae bacterium]
MAKALRCLLGLHRWQVLRVEGGPGSYKQCRDCGRFRDIDDRPKLA